VNRNPAQFDVRKLEAINGDKIRALDPADFVSRIIPFLQRADVIDDPVREEDLALVTAAAPHIQTRISRLTEAPGMLGFLFADEERFEVNAEDAEKALGPDAVPVLQAAEAALAEVQPWTAEAIEAALFAALVEPTGLGLKPRAAFAPVRVAVTGRRVSPPLYVSIELLGRERTLARLAHAVKMSG
jgi:glutamyl-tRNA synthetase